LLKVSIPQSVWWMTRNSRVPRSFEEMIRDLMASVEGSYLKGNIREGFERSLYAKLRNALAAVKGQRPDPVACNALTAFSNEVQAQSGKQLTGEQANQLIRAASDIVTRLGCPTRG